MNEDIPFPTSPASLRSVYGKLIIVGSAVSARGES
jgi:hypothetical protein